MGNTFLSSLHNISRTGAAVTVRAAVQESDELSFRVAGHAAIKGRVLSNANGIDRLHFNDQQQVEVKELLSDELLRAEGCRSLN